MIGLAAYLDVIVQTRVHLRRYEPAAAAPYFKFTPEDKSPCNL